MVKTHFLPCASPACSFCSAIDRDRFLFGSQRQEECEASRIVTFGTTFSALQTPYLPNSDTSFATTRLEQGWEEKQPE